MAKIDTYGEIYISDILKNYLQAENTSICQFLYFADFSDISRHIEDKYYSDRNEHLRYPIGSMPKLCIIKQFRALSYSKTVDSLTQEEAWLLGFERDGRDPEIYKVPSGSTLHHFVKYRLGVDGIDEIMMLVGKELVKDTTLRVAKTDSTPLEASRYNKYAECNPHYECEMDKAHITMIGTWPVFMTHTSGNAGDSPEQIAHIKVLKN